MKGQGGGGTAKGGGKSRSGGGSVKVVKTKARKTAALESTILRLREALFDPSGNDKNVLTGIAPSFLTFQRNGLGVTVHFSAKLAAEELDWAFDMTKSNMEDRYDSSGYGWDDDDKERELTEDGARFLLLRNMDQELVGFVHFRFTVQGEVIDQMAGDSCLFVVDLHLDEAYQRKGLGKHLLVLLELVARREKMSRVSMPVYLGDEITRTWLSKQKGYEVDDSCALFGFDSEMEGFEVFSKVFTPPSSSGASRPVTSTASAREMEALSTVLQKVQLATAAAAPVDDSAAKDSSAAATLDVSTDAETVISEEDSPVV